jgi:hypothetical protein
VTRRLPLPPPDEPTYGQSCDGGNCDRESVGYRWFTDMSAWLPCRPTCITAKGVPPEFIHRDPADVVACGQAGEGSEFQTTDEALEWLRSIVVPVYGDVRSTKGLLWATSEIAHPSRHGGDRTLWDRYEAAKRLLDLANPRPAYWKKAP